MNGSISDASLKPNFSQNWIKTLTCALYPTNRPLFREFSPIPDFSGTELPVAMGWFKNKQTSSHLAESTQRTQYASPKPAVTRTQMQEVPEMRVEVPELNDSSMTERPPMTADTGLMVVDQPPTSNVHQAYNVTPQVSQDFSRDIELEQAEMGSTKQNHLNSLFNGHLMKWKFEAEEGSGFIRIPAFFGGLGLIGTAITALVLEEDSWTAPFIVMSVCVVVMGIFIVILDGRFLATNPLSARAHLRNIMTRNFNIFRFLWGRGLLYISAGVLSLSHVKLITMISGAVMVLIGIIALCVGIYSSRKFAALRNSLADESFLLLVFSNYDSDGDGYINPSEFALLIQDLGIIAIDYLVVNTILLAIPNPSRVIPII